jgi:REP element-mobilizing transposase RayT
MRGSGIAGHITHRCHKREFLLKFDKDKKRWMDWLFEAKKRYGLSILNYVVTSNHIIYWYLMEKKMLFQNRFNLLLEEQEENITKERVGKGRFGRIDIMQQPLKPEGISFNA